MKTKRILAGILAACFVGTTLAGCVGSTPVSVATEDPAAASMGGDAAATDTSNAEFEMVISNIVPDTDVINYLGYQPLKEYIEAESDGRIAVTIFSNRQLSNSNVEDVEKVNNNIVQMSTAPTSAITSATGVAAFQVFDMPYLFESDEEIYAYMDEVLEPSYAPAVTENTDMISYPVWSTGWCKISSNEGPIDSMEALAGKKIRVLNSDMYIEVCNALGATGVPIDYGETFTALQQGTVDGLMTATSLWVDDRFMEVQEYMVDANPFPIVHMPVINKTWFESLPEDLQQVVDDGIRNVFIENLRGAKDLYEADKLAELEEYGMNITYLTDEQRQEFIDATSYIITDMGYDLVGEDVITEAQAFTEEYRAGGGGDMADESMADESEAA